MHLAVQKRDGDATQALFITGDTLANSESWPDWYKGNEFRGARDKTMAAAKH